MNEAAFMFPFFSGQNRGRIVNRQKTEKGVNGGNVTPDEKYPESLFDQ
jgi:hypothetical protein